MSAVWPEIASYFYAADVRFGHFSDSHRRLASVRKLTVERYWPGIEAHFSAPKIAFPDEVSNIVGVLGVIDEMVGDIDRIQRYPALGYQAAHTLPGEIIDAWHTT